MFIDPNIWYDEQEMRKQVEQSAGKFESLSLSSPSRRNSLPIRCTSATIQQQNSEGGGQAPDPLSRRLHGSSARLPGCGNMSLRRAVLAQLCIDILQSQQSHIPAKVGSYVSGSITHRWHA